MRQEFKQAVDSGNVARVRIGLSNELLLDPRGASFTEMLNYAKANLDDLFEENQEANYTVPPQDQWDKEFLLKVKDDLDLNFSIEKLAFYQAVIEQVEKDKISEMNRIEDERRAAAEATASANEPSVLSKVSATSTTVTTGGAVLTILGLCLGKTLLTIAGGAVLIGGVLLIINDVRK